MTGQLTLELEPVTSLRGALRTVGAPAALIDALELLPIAGEEVERAGLTEGFELLVPGSLAGYSSELYREHCRELIARMGSGEDTRPATRAEVLVGLLRASLVAPLRSAGQALAEHLFAELFPETFSRVFPDEHARAREEWPGQVAEDLADARRRLAQPWRTR